MKRIWNYSKKICSNIWLQVFLILNWMIQMEKIETPFTVGYDGAMQGLISAYSSVYMLCGLGGLFCMWFLRSHKSNEKIARQHKLVLGICAGVFSLSVLLANFDLFFPIQGKMDLIKIPVFLAGGMAVCLPVLMWMYRKIGSENNVRGNLDANKHPQRIFWLYFLTIASAYLVYLKFSAYPGYFSGDTMSIFRSVAEGVYSKRLPIWYMLFVKFCLWLGSLLGGEGSSALVVYTVIQIHATAAVLAYGIVTLYQLGVPRWCRNGIVLLMLFLPYQVHYSVTIWKDIPFALSGFSLAIALYRIFDQIGDQKRNYYALAVSSFVFCLSRTNGWYSFCGMLLVLLIFLKNRKQHSAFFGISLLVIGIAWLMIGPVADRIASDRTDYLEIMSIPFQQVGRLIWKEYDLPAEDLALLSNVLDLEKVKQLYNPYIVDPMKFVCFDRLKYDYFMDNLGQYASLWLRWGVKHPFEYLAAWIEETKGYWNGGYNYYMYVEYGQLEEMGFIRPELNNFISRGYRMVFGWLEGPTIFQFLYSIGFQSWLLMGTSVISLLKKRKVYMLSLPSLVVLGGLWFCTPVFAEFRYAYIVFLTVPFLLAAAFFANTNKEDISSEPSELCK